MKSTKKLISLLLCAVIVLGLLVGCGGQSEKAASESSPNNTSLVEPTVPVEVNVATATEDTILTAEDVSDSYEIPCLTVEELEDAINGYLHNKGLALECFFITRERRDHYSDDSLNTGACFLELKFFFTDWDDPDTAYPNIKLSDGYVTPDFAKKRFIHETFPISVEILAKGATRNAPVYKINYSHGPLVIEEPLFGSYTITYDDSWQTFPEDIRGIICDLWSNETSDDTLSAFLRGERNEPAAFSVLEDECKTIDGHEIEHISGYFESENTYCYTIDSSPNGINFLYWPLCGAEFHDSEDLLDSDLLECSVDMKNSILWDEDEDQDFRTGLYQRDSYETIALATGLLDDYLRDTGNKLVLRDMVALCDANGSVNKLGNRIVIDHYYDFKVNLARGKGYTENYEMHLDSNYFGILNIHDDASVHNLNDTMSFYQAKYDMSIGAISEAETYMVYYNEKVECPVEYEYVLRVPIGLSQIYDAGMTADEAIALHTEEQEVLFTYGDWGLSIYAPRDVYHVICRNYNSGQVLYSAVPKTVFEICFGSLEDFASHPKTISLYEDYLEKGYLDNGYVPDNESLDTGYRFKKHLYQYNIILDPSGFFTKYIN